MTLAALNEELERGWGVRLANRTGVNTGEVVAGDVTAGQRLVTGDTVNVAARLEQAAARRGGAARRADVPARPRRGRGRDRRSARPEGQGGAGARLQGCSASGKPTRRSKGTRGRSSAESGSWDSSSRRSPRRWRAIAAGSRPCSEAQGWGSRAWSRSSSRKSGERPRSCAGAASRTAGASPSGQSSRS